MRRIRIFAHLSLDGVIAPSGRGEDSDYARSGWTTPYRTPAGAAAVAAAQGTTFDLLLGRRTYDPWAAFWPKVPSSPIADGLKAATKYVAIPRAREPRMGPGWRPRRGHHRRYPRHQVERGPRLDRLGKYDSDVRTVRAGTGR